jgi:hypothetical protein
MALEERTGAAKTSVPSKKKKGMYEDRRIVVFLGGLDLMRVNAGEPLGQSFYTPGTTYSQAVLRLPIGL